MTTISSVEILRDGLVRRNVGLVQLLGLCPLLAVSSSVVNGLGLGLATLFVLCSTNLAVSVLRPLLTDALRIPLFVLIIATLVTVVELVLKAWFPELDSALGIFVPLIVTNCMILARAEAFASRQPPPAALLDGVATGLGFAAVLIGLGALRELVGRGSLFAGMEHLLGSWATVLEVSLPVQGLLLAVLPPGAFIGLGLMIALMRWRTGKSATDPATPAPISAGHRP